MRRLRGRSAPLPLPLSPPLNLVVHPWGPIRGAMYRYNRLRTTHRPVMTRHHPPMKRMLLGDLLGIIFIGVALTMGIVGEEMDERDILEECICVQIHLYIYKHSVEIMPYQF